LLYVQGDRFTATWCAQASQSAGDQRVKALGEYVVKPGPAAHLTEEDTDIWLSILSSYDVYWPIVGPIFRDSDRKDAIVMLMVETIRHDLKFPVDHVWYMLLKGYMYIDALGNLKV
jgi:hypothetical protein